MKMEAAIEAFMLRHPLREKKLVAVSGGRDSVGLLYALHEAGHRNLVVCHLDHRLRGRASAGDAAFVKRLAEKLGVACESGAVDVKEAATGAGVSLETAGRQERHRFLADCARRHRCRLVLLAHHADDQAETVLFNLFRGSSGLRGISTMTEIRVPGFRQPLCLERPLLAVSRAELDAWMAAREIKFREDATNGGTEPVRNKLRHLLLPAICEAMGRDVRPAICRAAEIASSEQAFLDALVMPAAQEPTLDTRPLAALPLALQRRTILLWLKAQGFPGTGFDEVEAVRGMLDPGSGPARVNLPGNRFVRRTRGKLHTAM